MAVSYLLCFISCTQIFFKYTGLYEEIGTWSYRHDVLYVKLRRAKDRLKHNMRKLALLKPSLYIGTTPIMLKIAKSSSLGNIPLGRCWVVYIRLGLKINDFHATPLYFSNWSCYICNIFYQGLHIFRKSIQRYWTGGKLLDSLVASYEVNTLWPVEKFT